MKVGHLVAEENTKKDKKIKVDIFVAFQFQLKVSKCRENQNHYNATIKCGQLLAFVLQQL